MKKIILFIIIITTLTFAQTKQDSLKVRRVQLQFQKEVQKEQQLENELNIQKIKAFDAWMKWQKALIIFQKSKKKVNE